MKYRSLFPLLAALGVFTACSAPNDQTAAAASSNGSTAMPVAAPAASRHGTATGTIQAIDPAAGTVTISHGPVPELSWPAMTMAFHASADQLQGLKPGDHVAFDFTMAGMKATIDRIDAQ
jgi:Cu(I)/Ag(I) efflux system protein CusF